MWGCTCVYICLSASECVFFVWYSFTGPVLPLCTSPLTWVRLGLPASAMCSPTANGSLSWYEHLLLLLPSILPHQTDPSRSHSRGTGWTLMKSHGQGYTAVTYTSSLARPTNLPISYCMQAQCSLRYLCYHSRYPVELAMGWSHCWFNKGPKVYCWQGPKGKWSVDKVKGHV